jgi:type I restriction enzyme S subunit
VERPIPLVKVQDVVNADKYLIETQLNITDEGLDNSSAYILPENNLVFTMYGTAGEAAINRISVAPTQNVLGIIPKKEVESDFLYYALKHSKSLALEKIVDRTIFKHFTLEKAKTLLIAKPLSNGERKNISHILTLIQSAIQKQEQIIRITTELKNALMQKLFTEGTKGEAQKQTEIGLIPESWEVVELKKTGDVIYGIQAAVANNTNPIGTKILTNVNISLDGRIDLQKVRYYKLKSKRDFNTILQQGDILFNWRSGSKEHVGKTAIFDLEGEYTHSSFILRIRPNNKVVNHYLYLYLNHLRSTGYFVKQQTYSINAKFNKSAIEVLPVVLPEKDEQLIISNTIKTINNKLEHHQTKKQTLTALFRSMLHQLMTGQIRVKDLNIKKRLTLRQSVAESLYKKKTNNARSDRT